MSLKKRLLLILYFTLLLNIIGCANENGDNNNNVNDGNTNNQSINETPGRYSAQGRIVKIDKDGLHVENNDKVDVYSVDQEQINNYYIGEYVGLNKLDGDKYEAVSDEYYDYNSRHTSSGEPIRRISGTVGEITDDYLLAVTEMGDVKLSNLGDIDLKSGDQFIVDYVEKNDENQIISYYNEVSRIHVTVKEISRDTSGMMRLYGIADDKKEYDIFVGLDTITNFAHSSLNTEEEIVVYPNDISGDIPAVVDAKLIILDEE